MMRAVMATIPAVRGRLPRLDLMTLLSCAVAALVYALHGFDGYLSRDLGVYSYGGQQVAEGVPPYDAIVNRAGPLAHLIPGAGVIVSRWVGLDDILGMRLLFLVISVACIGLVQVLGRDLFRSRLAGITTAGGLLCIAGFIEYASNGPREKTAMVLFVICALLATVHQRWATTGFFIALATLTWQPVFLAAFASTLVAILLGLDSGRTRAVVRVAVGGLVPTVVTVAAYSLVSDLQVFLDDFLIINARYTEQISLLSAPREAWDLMVVGYGASLWVLIAGTVALLALSVRATFQRSGGRDPRNAALVAQGVMFVVGLLWSLKAFNGWPDIFFLLPGAALGIGGVVALLARHVPGRVALAVTLAWVVAASALAVDYSVTHRDHRLDDQRDSVAAVLAALPDGSRILSVEAPQPLVIAHERNLSRLQLFGNGLIDYVDDTWPGGRDGYARWVGRKAPTVIALGYGDNPSWLQGVLADYERMAGPPGWTWYIRKDVGEETLRTLRSALLTQSRRVEG